MQVSLKLLLYLSPDEACIDDIAEYVYGNNSLLAQNRTRQIIYSLRNNGWKIAIKTYQLDQDQYQLIQELGGYEELFGGKSLQPEKIKSFLSRWRRNITANC